MSARVGYVEFGTCGAEASLRTSRRASGVALPSARVPLRCWVVALIEQCSGDTTVDSAVKDFPVK